MPRKLQLETNRADDRWVAVKDRDAAADGKFVYAVTTTGVYCRPGCSSRTPKREHVRFFVDPQEASRAGFRACRRCKPEQLSAAEERATMVASACRMIETAEEVPALAELARRFGMSTFHFQRVFKSVAGVTPKQYAIAHRVKRVRTSLRQRPTVTDAIYDAGYNSSSRFYERANEMLGMAPSSYRDGGKNATIQFAFGRSKLGVVLVGQSERGICSILLGDSRAKLAGDLRALFPRARLIETSGAFAETVRRVTAFVDQPDGRFDLPLDICGTAFQQRVWNALQTIPVGGTATYQEVAKKIGEPSSVRAVARACASNRLAIAIPCHRVVRADGKLAGYRWGVERKKQLLRRESQVSK